MAGAAGHQGGLNATEPISTGVANFSGNTGLLAPHLLSANSRLISAGSLRATQ